MRNIFRGYVEVPLPQDDDALPKWNAVKHADIAGTYSASWQSIGEMNAIVNATVQYTDDPDDHWQTAAHDAGDWVVVTAKIFAALKFGILRHINVAAWGTKDGYTAGARQRVPPSCSRGRSAVVLARTRYVWKMARWHVCMSERLFVLPCRGQRCCFESDKLTSPMARSVSGFYLGHL